MSYALDLTEGQPMGHAMQTCIIGMRIARQLQLPYQQQSDLYYALLLKDAGCSSNASKLHHILQSDEIKAKGDLKDKDWTRPSIDGVRYLLNNVAVGKPFLERARLMIRIAVSESESCALIKLRCERGAAIARQIGFPREVSLGIAGLDEQWNGAGYPQGAKGEEIPLISRIMNLSQTLAVFWTIGGPSAALEVMRKRSGRWFDPELVRAASALGRDGSLWIGLDEEDAQHCVTAMEPCEQLLSFDAGRIDDLCLAFSEVIDAKSPFTALHSQGVAAAALAIGGTLGLPKADLLDLWRGSLLHDVGKLAVPNTILEKPGKLTEAEWQVVYKHPYYTLEILKRVPGFAALSEVAAAHHERLDGTGYFRSWHAGQLSLPARILAVADVFDALAAARPYRDALPLDAVFDIMLRDAPHALDLQCLEALQHAPPVLAAAPIADEDAEPIKLPPSMVPKHAF